MAAAGHIRRVYLYYLAGPQRKGSARGSENHSTARKTATCYQEFGVALNVMLLSEHFQCVFFYKAEN